MNNVTYGLSEEIYALGNEKRVSYGIVAYSNAELDGTATIISSVRDVSSDRQAMVRLISQCNRLQLSPRSSGGNCRGFSDKLSINKKQITE